MNKTSVFNDVLGPVMRGPSSSHTAGSYRIGRMVRDLCGAEPNQIRVIFDPDGSYSQVFREQGVDLAFASGLIGWSITDERFSDALDLVQQKGMDLSFHVEPLERADHPNAVRLLVTTAAQRCLAFEARSTGGGGIQITRLQDWELELDGKYFVYLLECSPENAVQVSNLLESHKAPNTKVLRLQHKDRILLQYTSEAPWSKSLADTCLEWVGPECFYFCDPVFYLTPGEPIFSSGLDMVALSQQKGISLGQIAWEYESILLGLSKEQTMQEMQRRLEIMQASVQRGLNQENVHMQLLPPSAGKIFRAEAEGRVAVGGMHTRAAARAMASMHVCNSQGVVCAAPTGGAAGVLPGVAVTMLEDLDVSFEKTALALFAAAAIGLIVARRATFAAEIAGCQVEIGAAGAMGAAAVVEMSGGSAQQAADAAAISFQNTMGSVCDLVQGMCEIPCHTRNAAAASAAFVCADIILGGYGNPVSLDETIDAVLSCGRMLPSELRVTSKGGLALAPSARALPRLR